MQNLIKCPNCSHQFQVEQALAKQTEEKIRLEYEHKIAEKEASLKKESDGLKSEKELFEQNKSRENELFQQRLSKKIEEEKLQLVIANQTVLDEKLKAFETEKTKIKDATKSEFELKIKSLEEEAEERRQENMKLKALEIDFLKKNRALQEREVELQFQYEKKMLDQSEEIRIEAQKREQEKAALKEREYEKRLEDQRKLIEEMRRKSEQGSMQMQGEVLEIALEELLSQAFQYDQIEEVQKGVKGADLILTVMNDYHRPCGQIIFESKRTKNFTEAWIEKLKDDQRNQGAQLAVIVTETMPKDMDKFGWRDGVWICTFQDVKGLTFVLREMLLRESAAKASEENKGDKMGMLYNYLIGADFHQRVEATVEGFSSLQHEMEREKRAMQKIWKEREKQIEKVITNTIDMYGSIKGIGGAVIQPVKALELPFGEED